VRRVAPMDYSLVCGEIVTVGEAAPCGPAARGVTFGSWEIVSVGDHKRGRGRAVRRAAPQSSLNPPFE